MISLTKTEYYPKNQVYKNTVNEQHTTPGRPHYLEDSRKNRKSSPKGKHQNLPVYTDALKPLVTRELLILSRTKVSEKFVKLFASSLTKRDDLNLTREIARAQTNTSVL